MLYNLKMKKIKKTNVFCRFLYNIDSLMLERLQIINPFFAKSTVMLQQVGKYFKKELSSFKGTVSRDGFWLLMSCMVNSRPKKGDAASF